MTHNERRMTVHAPAALPDNAMVTFALFDGPSPALDAALREIGFFSSRYPDVRAGKAGQLRAALAAAEAANTRVWKAVNGAHQILPALPDATTYASAIIGAACPATWAEDVSVERDARLHLEGGRVLVWGEATLAIGA